MLAGMKIYCEDGAIGTKSITGYDIPKRKPADKKVTIELLAGCLQVQEIRRRPVYGGEN